MMQHEVIQFFDRLAPTWDGELIRNEAVIRKILDNAGIRPGVNVLDVACGTGVLIPDYLQRGAASVTAIDISPEMARIAGEKFPQATVLCGDAEQTDFGRLFDVIMIYNAFPHFPEPQRLVEGLGKWLKPGGRLSVAHGMSRRKLQTYHGKTASKVSIDLLEAGALAALFTPYYRVDVQISDDTMYQVCGTKR